MVTSSSRRQRHRLLLNEELHKRTVAAYEAVASKARETGQSYREAAFEIGVERVARAIKLRGFV